MGSRAGFRVPPPPAVDLRVGELFPGGRWKHRTNSPSTTSTLMVEIAATTKKSMAVPERRCMRRWSVVLQLRPAAAGSLNRLVKQAIRPAIFTWRQTEPELILCAVRWYLRDSLSFRDGEERLRERGLEADHTTIWRWVQHDGPELEERLRRHLKPTKRSWRVDETDVCVRGRWGSLSRALDSAGATIDFVRSGWRGERSKATRRGT